MNRLYTSSWAKNVKPNATALWNEEFKELVNEGTRGRAAHPAYAKLMGMKSVQELKGKFTPRYFVTKVLKQIEKDHPNEKIEDVIANITDDDITNMMNLAAQMSRKLETKPELKFGAEKAEKKAPVTQRFEKGKDQIDTLKKNLDDSAEFHYVNDVGNNTVYSTKHKGLNYRVTVKNGTGEPMSLSDILNSHVLSLQIEDPSSETTVEGPQTDPDWESKLGSHKRHKLVADYPHEGAREGEDWNEPDPEETGGVNVKRGEDEEDSEDMTHNMTKEEAAYMKSTKPEEDFEEDVQNTPPDGKTLKFPLGVGEEDNEEVVKLSPQEQQRQMYNQMMYKRRRMIEVQRRNDLGY